MLRYSLSFTGLLASLCYLFQWLVCIGASWLTDLIRTKGILSTIAIRRINTWLGLWVTGACTAIAGYAGCNGELTVALLVLSAGLNFLTVPGCKSGTLDIAPSYSGILAIDYSSVVIPVQVLCLGCPTPWQMCRGLLPRRWWGSS